jgi:hypothetical protein
MELWVRSQDREHLMKTTDVDLDCDDKRAILINNYHMGVYKTKERALEVLDEIEERLTMLNTLNLVKNELMLEAYKNAMGEDKIKGIGYPYQMPKE